MRNKLNGFLTAEKAFSRKMESDHLEEMFSHKRSEHRTPSKLVTRTLVHNNFTHVFSWGCHTKIQMTVNSFNVQPTIASMFGLASNTENAHWHHYAFPWQHTLISHFSQGYFKLALFETCSSINLSWFSINFTKKKLSSTGHQDGLLGKSLTGIHCYQQQYWSNIFSMYVML